MVNNFAAGSSVFPPRDRLPNQWDTTNSSAYKSYPPPKKTSSALNSLSHAVKAAGPERSALPFLHKNEPAISESRVQFRHHGAAYLPENLRQPSVTDSQSSAIQFGTSSRDDLNSIHRASFIRHQAPRSKTAADRMQGMVLLYCVLVVTYDDARRGNLLRLNWHDPRSTAVSTATPSSSSALTCDGVSATPSPLQKSKLRVQVQPL